MLSKTLTKAQLQKEVSPNLITRIVKAILRLAVIVFFLICTGTAMAGIAYTSEAPTDGPLPKTPIRQGSLASGVRESIR